jgi:carboxymethylenebutenolidase
MCHDPASRPPDPPLPSGEVRPAEGARVALTAGDGTRFSAFSARPDSGGGPGIVILPDVRGLHPFYEQLALRFAAAGVAAVAIDYFGRTAGVGERGDDFDYMAHIRQCRAETIALDVAAAVAHLHAPEGGGATSVFTVGFCFGGRQSFNQAAEAHELAGVVGFYGGVAPLSPAMIQRFGIEDTQDRNAPLLRVHDFTCPVLGLFGGADPGITAEHRAAFDKALGDAGIPHELVVYEGAPHSFFDRRFEEYQQACEDAWRRVLTFVAAPASVGGGPVGA